MLCCSASHASATPTSQFGGEGFLQKVSQKDMEDSVRTALEAVLHGSTTVKRKFTSIKSLLQPTYSSLPKDRNGQFSLKSIEFMVQSYFSMEHGWFIHGLDYTWRGNYSNVMSAEILYEKAPILKKALLSAGSSSQNFGMDDAVVMIAALEQLVLSDAERILERAYRAQHLGTSGKYSADTVLKLLLSYALAFDDTDLDDSSIHRLVKDLLKSPRDLYVDVADALGAYRMERHRERPFDNDMYSFEDVMHVAVQLFASFGRTHSRHCRDMKNALIDMSREGTRPHAHGRVLLQDFYVPKTTYMFRFNEGSDYLESIAALDNSQPGRPSVIIPNYIQGPSNCLRNSPYFWLCCISECEELTTSIQGQLQKPKATPQEILDIVRNLSSDTVDAPRKISQALVTKLHDVASYHGGMVPLHGRLFMQWLHFAYPNECAYPSVPKNGSAAWPTSLKEGVYRASREEIQSAQIAPVSTTEALVEEMQREEAHLSLWHEFEVVFIDQFDTSSLHLAIEWLQE